MPEDTVSNVSALMEFLYTGNYTYTYDAEGMIFQEESKTLLVTLLRDCSK